MWPRSSRRPGAWRRRGRASAARAAPPHERQAVERAPGQGGGRAMRPTLDAPCRRWSSASCVARAPSRPRRGAALRAGRRGQLRRRRSPAAALRGVGRRRGSRAVLTDLGGVSPANAILLKEPKVRDLVQATRRPEPAGLRGRAAGGRRPHRGARLLLGARRREGTAARRRPLLVPEPARPPRRDAGRRAHRRARRLRVRRIHAPQGREGAQAVPGGRVGQHARPRLPHLERRDRGGAGIGPHRRARTSRTTSSRACAARPT